MADHAEFLARVAAVLDSAERALGGDAYRALLEDVETRVLERLGDMGDGAGEEVGDVPADGFGGASPGGIGPAEGDRT